MKCTIVMISLLTLFWNIELKAKNYYISNSGNDSANGTSPATAWKTINHVNSRSFSPGDSILFRCGDRWMEMIEPDDDGTTSNYIVYSSYGTGAKPKLYGSISSVSFKNETGIGANVFSTVENIPLNPNTVRNYRSSIWFVIKDSVIRGDGYHSYKPSTRDLSKNYDWAYSDNKIFFYYNGNINDINTVECPQIERAFLLNIDYIEINGFDMRYQVSRCIGVGYPTPATKGLTVRNCHLAYVGSAKDNTVGHGYGIETGYSDVLIEKNVIHGTGRRMVGFHAYGGVPLTIRDIIIQDNIMYDAWHANGWGIHCNSLNDQLYNVHVRRNFVWDIPGKDIVSNVANHINSSGDVKNMDSIYIYNNILIFNGSVAYLYEANGLHFYYNTFVGLPDAKGYQIYYAGYGGHGHSIFKNNIFYSPLGSDIKTTIKGKGSYGQTLELDNNLYCDAECIIIVNDLNGRTYYQNRLGEWKQLQGDGYEVNSLPPIQTPHFVNPVGWSDAANFALKSSSPAIGKATPINNIDGVLSITTDFYGNPRDPVTPDIGAVEYNDSSVAIKDIKHKKDIVSIYPNPSSTNLTMLFKEDIKGKYSVRLYNLQGRMVYESDCLYENKHSINTNHFSKGMYFIKLVSDNQELKAAKILFQ